ncbi:hypothetical protein V8E36_009248 [Tilletia maclaganii]
MPPALLPLDHRLPVLLNLARLATDTLLSAKDDDAQPPPPSLSVPAAIVLGLVASFIQSLGIALQRGSHLQNDALPPAQRRVELRRPKWLIGFAIFMVGTISTVLQIGALPIVILAPLGAVSLLYNAVLARFLLNTTFSKFMVAGTLLITLGAVLIALFGAITESPHSLDELLRLFARPPFVATSTILAFVLFSVLFIAHLAEWQLQIRSYRINLGPEYWKSQSRRSSGAGGKKKKKGSNKGSMRRRWSAPTLAPLAEVNENASGIATPAIASNDEATRRAAGLGTYSGASSSQQHGRHRHRNHYGATSSSLVSPKPNRDASSNGTPAASSTAPPKGTAGNGASEESTGGRAMSASPSTASSLSSTSTSTHASDSAEQPTGPTLADQDPGIRRTKTLLAIAYAGASGTLSGACLLLAKSGIELVLLSLAGGGGGNQFRRWQSWALVGIMLGAALCQLWYLNKALRFESPVLVMPLAFCFYNTASIALGLVYFDQLGALAWWNICLVILGTILLLTGVWVVSLHSEEEVEAEREEEQALVGLVSTCASPITLEVGLPSASSSSSTIGEDEAVETLMDERQPLLASTNTPTISPSKSALKKEGEASSPLTPTRTSSGHLVRRRAQSLATDVPIPDDGGSPGSSMLLTPTRLQFARRTPPERRAVHFLSRSASLSLGLGFAPSMQEEEDGEENGLTRSVSAGRMGSEGSSAAVEPSGRAVAAAGGQGSGSREGAAGESSSQPTQLQSQSSSTTPAALVVAVPQLSYASFFKRGLSIGIGVGSPGFYVQPTGIRSTSSSSSIPEDEETAHHEGGAHQQPEQAPTFLSSFTRFRIGRRHAGSAGMSKSARTRTRMRPGRSASETDVADAFLEEEAGPSSSSSAVSEGEEVMIDEEDEGGNDDDDSLLRKGNPRRAPLAAAAPAEDSGSASSSGVTIRTNGTAAQPSSGWATELDTEALSDRLGRLAGWERIRRVLGLGAGRR